MSGSNLFRAWKNIKYLVKKQIHLLKIHIFLQLQVLVCSTLHGKRPCTSRAQNRSRNQYHHTLETEENSILGAGVGEVSPSKVSQQTFVPVKGPEILRLQLGPSHSALGIQQEALHTLFFPPFEPLAVRLMVLTTPAFLGRDTNTPKGKKEIQ